MNVENFLDALNINIEKTSVGERRKFRGRVYQPRTPSLYKQVNLKKTKGVSEYIDYTEPGENHNS